MGEDLSSADFDLRWPAGLLIEPPITVYDVTGAVVPNAVVQRSGTQVGSQMQESISVESPVPIGRIKLGPVGGIMYVDNLIY